MNKTLISLKCFSDRLFLQANKKEFAVEVRQVTSERRIIILQF